MTNAGELHPGRIPGYHEGPFARRLELLDQRLFWHGHLYACAQGGAGWLLWGAEYDWANHRNFQRQLWDRGDWPAFTIPLAAGHRLYVVYRTVEDEAGIDYLLHHPDWDQADPIARDEGNFVGPGLSWSELAAAVDNAPSNGATIDAHTSLLLLLPALGDTATPEHAVPRLAAALSARLGVEAPSHSLPPCSKARDRPAPHGGPPRMATCGSTTAGTPSATLAVTSLWHATAWHACPPP